MEKKPNEILLLVASCQYHFLLCWLVDGEGRYTTFFVDMRDKMLVESVE